MGLSNFPIQHSKCSSTYASSDGEFSLVLSIGNSKSNHLGAPGTFHPIDRCSIYRYSFLIKGALQVLMNRYG